MHAFPAGPRSSQQRAVRRCFIAGDGKERLRALTAKQGHFLDDKWPPPECPSADVLAEGESFLCVPRRESRGARRLFLPKDSAPLFVSGYRVQPPTAASGSAVPNSRRGSFRFLLRPRKAADMKVGGTDSKSHAKRQRGPPSL
ncbi:hypothetical protein AAFF_G00435510 [Aldrovandia affinis]|uniref:Uncharacterized protein n=1 Tax=Aldrovandia affinis TaxID=143900 RepID=A0AAD7S8A9_9TELE|nr:hypothetical protein AAFF_G00435510 [Aldrovandia affinis]